MSSFDQAVNLEMRRLAGLPNVLFYGQSIRYDGAAIYDSFDGVPIERRIEMPVVEEFQLGFCIGAALAGVLPVCVYPRMDFMLLAANQFVNHLDKLPHYGWRIKLIIRTRVGNKTPLDAGLQHTQNHCAAFRLMAPNVRLIEVYEAHEVELAYRSALDHDGASLIVENPRSEVQVIF